MLVILFPDGNHSNRKLWHVRDVFEPGDELADGNVSGVEICGVIRPPEQSSEVIGCRSVGEEDTVQDCISRRGLEGCPNVGTTVGTQSNQTSFVSFASCRDYAKKISARLCEGDLWWEGTH